LIKSEESPKKILSLIPLNLKKYFLRGLFDGDGNFYINKKQGLYHFYLHGSINQKYDVLEEYLDNLQIPYKIDRKKIKSGGCSYLRIVGKKHVLKLGESIYNNYDTDLIGFNRKHNKFLEIKNS
jgi:intein/homing endonuclease